MTLIMLVLGSGPGRRTIALGPEAVADGDAGGVVDGAEADGDGESLAVDDDTTAFCVGAPQESAAPRNSTSRTRFTS